MLKQISFWALTCLSLSAWAQTSSTYIAPFQTNANYATGQDSHLVVRNAATQNGKLFLFLGGTSSKPSSYTAIAEFPAELGFDVINLSYLNGIAAASMTNNTDSLVFDHYRQEICYGTSLSSVVQVDSFNSIYQRTIELLKYLEAIYPTQNWSQYMLSPKLLDWSKIIVGGHSQGAGHACYFGKMQMIERVLMFAGPNDYSNHFQKSAKWIRTTGVTPISKQFAYLSLLDEVVDFNEQRVNLQGLGLYPQYDSVLIDQSSPPYNNSRFLYTTQRRGFALIYHNTPIKDSALNEAAWTYMLESDVSTSRNVVSTIHSLQIYPNPLKDQAYTNQNILNAEIQIHDLLGRLLHFIPKNPSTHHINLRNVPKGIFSISIRTEKADYQSIVVVEN